MLQSGSWIKPRSGLLSTTDRAQCIY